MLRKGIFIFVLIFSLLSTSAYAKDKPECVIPTDKFSQMCTYKLDLTFCKLTSAGVHKLNEYFNSHQDTGGFRLLDVDFDKMVGIELADMLAANKTIFRLELVYTHFGDEGIKRLASNTKLLDLKLYNNYIDDAGLLTLVNNKSITSIEIGEDAVSIKAILQFLDQHPVSGFTLYHKDVNDKEMDELFVKHPYFTSVGLYDLNVHNINALKNLKDLTELSIGPGIDIDDEAADVIAQLTNLQKLHFADVNISSTATAKFAQLKKLKMVESVNWMVEGGFGDEGVKFMASLPNLTTVYLYGQKITDKGARYLSENKGLRDISLLKNHIGDAGAIAISSNPNLEQVDLSENEIGDVGAASFANHKFLTRLSLAYNKIRDLGGIALTNQANFGRHSDDEYDYGQLILIGNMLTDVTAYAFAAQVTELDSLWIAYNQFSKTGIAALKRNSNIKSVWIDEDNAKAMQIKSPLQAALFHDHMKLHQLALHH